MKMQNNAEVKASSPIRTSLYEREGSMWGSLKRPSPRPTLFEECRSDDSDLCHELTDRYGFTPEEMHRAAERYHLGRSKSGKTIYWMIDELGIVRDGHLANSWVSQMLKSRCPSFLQDWYPHHCLFGQHQLSHEVEKFSGKFSSDFEGTRPTHTSESIKSIGIVESERSAVILSEARPELLWLAYAYPLNLTVDLFEPLQGHTITLFPRTDPNQDNYYAALEFADQVHRRYHLDFRVSSLLEDNATPAQKSAEIDLADFLFT